MIFVAVGTQKFPMNRLLRQIDELIASGDIQEEVIAQTGCSDYQPIHYVSRDFFGREEFDAMVEKCDLLITHSGVGTIVAGLTRGKRVIVYPRLAKYGEHVDDHQLQIAQAFSDQRFVLMCADTDSLAEKLRQAREETFAVYRSGRTVVLDTIRAYLDTI